MQQQAAGALSPSSQHRVSRHLPRCHKEKMDKQRHLLCARLQPWQGRAQQQQCLTWADGQGCSDVPQLDERALEVIPHDPAA